MNAVIDGDDIIYRDYVDISIAVGTPKVNTLNGSHKIGCFCLNHQNSLFLPFFHVLIFAFSLLLRVSLFLSSEEQKSSALLELKRP